MRFSHLLVLSKVNNPSEYLVFQTLSCLHYTQTAGRRRQMQQPQLCPSRLPLRDSGHPRKHSCEGHTPDSADHLRRRRQRPQLRAVFRVIRRAQEP